MYASRTTDGRPFKPKKLSVPFLYLGVPAGIIMIISLTKAALLRVHDFKSAFRLLSVWQSDFKLLKIFFDGKLYPDKYLPMGVLLL